MAWSSGREKCTYSPRSGLVHSWTIATSQGLEGAKITIRAQRRTGLHFWKDFASAEALLTQNPASVFGTIRAAMEYFKINGAL